MGRNEGKKTMKIAALTAVFLMAVIATSLSIYHKVWANDVREEVNKDVRTEKKTEVVCQEIRADVQKISHQEKDIYTDKYQLETDEQILKLKNKKEYSFSKPLLVENAYGTFTTALYYYARTDTPSYAKCKIVSEDAVTIENTLQTVDKKALVTEHIILLVWCREKEMTFLWNFIMNKMKSFIKPVFPINRLQTIRFLKCWRLRTETAEQQ